MKTLFRLATFIATLALAALLPLATAQAAPTTLVGTITSITLAPDGASATAVLKGRDGQDVTIHITDEETLDKFKDKRIVEGDEIRTRFDQKAGKNQSSSFRKTAGC